MKSFSTANAKKWIVSMIVPEEGLVNESPIRNPPRLYLWSDNILCATVLKSYDSNIYNKMVDKIVAVKQQYNLQCIMPWAFMCDPDVVSRVRMTDSLNHNADYNIPNTNYYYSNYDGTPFSEDNGYSNIQFLRAIYYYKQGKKDTAKKYYNMAMSTWDGYGFADKTFYKINIGEYELYKYAMYKIARKITDFSSVDPPCALAAMNQDNSGAVYTHYTKENVNDYKRGRTVKRVSSTNTEVASFCIIAGF